MWKAGIQERRNDMRKLFRMFFALASLVFLAVSMSGCGGGDDGAVAKPGAPTGVLATFNNSTSATVSWNPVDDATSYNVYYSSNPDFTLATATGVTEISGVTSPHHFQDATFVANTPYYFVVTAVNSAGTESLASLKVSAVYATFAQADLDGSWYITVFRAGVGNPPSQYGWLRMKVTLDVDGNATIDAYEQSDGDTDIPPGDLNFTIDADGIVTQAGDFGGLTSHNVMSSNKTLIVGTNTVSDTVQEIRIFQKADDSVTFSNADLAGQSFVFHQLASGAEPGWVHGAGSINTDRQVTITSITDSSGPGDLPAANYDTLSIDPATGVVTSSYDSSFQGVMSLDKKLIIGTTKDATGSFQLRIVQNSGQTFTMGDLEGAYNFASVFDGASALWQYGTLMINSSGLTSFLTYLDSTGSSDLPPNYTVSMSADGTITSASDATVHGTMSFNKDLFVSTVTVDPGGTELYGLSLAVK